MRTDSYKKARFVAQAFSDLIVQVDKLDKTEFRCLCDKHGGLQDKFLSTFAHIISKQSGIDIKFLGSGVYRSVFRVGSYVVKVPNSKTCSDDPNSNDGFTLMNAQSNNRELERFQKYPTELKYFFAPSYEIVGCVLIAKFEDNLEIVNEVSSRFSYTQNYQEYMYFQKFFNNVLNVLDSHCENAFLRNGIPIVLDYSQ